MRKNLAYYIYRKEKRRTGKRSLKKIMSVYFNRRNELKARAEKHTQEVEKNLKKETEECAASTITYGGDDGRMPQKVQKGKCTAEIIIDDLDSVKSVIRHLNGKTAVLNFASYKNPGGKFIEGSSAQEECLCHASNLYNVLSRFPGYYEWNKKHNNRALYTDRALYSKNVTFIDESVTVYGADPVNIQADVITCAAPNFSAAGKYAHVEEDENNAALLKRVKFVLDIAEDNHVETLILGAYGCGVFGQDALLVAKYFRKCLETYEYHFKTVYFSIINRGNEDNLRKFRTIFGTKN